MSLTIHMRIGLIQSKADEDRLVNIETAKKNIHQLSSKGANVICLPELFMDNYFPAEKNAQCQHLSLHVHDEIICQWQQLCKNNELILILPFFERDDKDILYNSVLVINEEGRIVTHYRKNHIPHDPYFWEQDCFEKGNLNYPIASTKYGNIGVLICYDQWFPEAARELSLQGADIIFYPTAIGNIIDSKEDWLDSWITVQKSHAITNSVHIAAVNRVGKENNVQFWGSSFITDGFGVILNQSSKTEEENLIIDIDLETNHYYKEEWGFFQNIRPETYNTIKSTNAINNNYYLPAEWEPHEGVWLAWPHDKESFPDNLSQVQDTYVELIQNLYCYEKVNLLVATNALLDNVKKNLTKANIDINKINIHVNYYQDIWIRDYGPIYIKNKITKKRAISHWSFNAWGKKYFSHISDLSNPSYIRDITKEDYFRMLLTLEGGAIEVNGEGVLLSNKDCVVDMNRNPYMDIQKIEKILAQVFSIYKFVWLEGKLYGDDTDGHIDTLARFINKETVLYCKTDNPKDINYNVLKRNESILNESFASNQQNINLVPVPIPTVIDKQGNILPASYLNFYIANTVVLVPTYKNLFDQEILEIFKMHFPNHKIIGIDCTNLIYGLGSIHCITQQIPI